MINVDKSINRILRTVLFIIVLMLLTVIVINLPVALNVINYIFGGGELVVNDFKYDYAFLAIVLTCVALCITISMIVPILIAKTIVKSEISNSVEELFNRNYKKSLDETLSSMRKSDADHSRMISYFLSELGKPVWSIGWICRASIRYILCNSKMTPMHETIVKTCNGILFNNFCLFSSELRKLDDISSNNVISIIDEENHEDTLNLLKRTTVDLVDFMIYPEVEPSEYFEERNHAISELCFCFIMLFMRVLLDLKYKDFHALSKEINRMSKLSNESVLKNLLERIAKEIPQNSTLILGHIEECLKDAENQ